MNTVPLAGDTPPKPNTGKGRLIICRNCREEKRYYADHLCSACWKRWDGAGRPAEVPPPRKRGQAAAMPSRLRDYVIASDSGTMSAAKTAKRLGVSPRTVYRYRARLRQGEVPA
ncbi:helix-turn-helix domain-containing protein [Actinoallomurus iriomotensis]|uniref:Uncharacterized protein n=1 Tax=Actinoallomurus iriomotensis TaxID=478107 RepID=A0A9W6VXJ7_9ACTN|nr:helix-turn-helix domain-containing protein [Actinoallomurus iriomotensis]GLY81876.1 hypothetical protein Airi01_101430 [Actinoallomurus iriomotensis]